MMTKFWTEKNNRLYKRRFSKQRRARHGRRLFLETLERRDLLAAITWNADGDATNWSDADNWDLDRLPTAGDDVSIPDVAATTQVAFTSAAGSVAIKSLTSDESFLLGGGSLSVTNTVQVNNSFTINGGTLADATVLPGSGGEGLTFTNNSNNRLQDVTLNLDVDMTTASVFLVRGGGLTLNGTATLGPAARSCSTNSPAAARRSMARARWCWPRPVPATSAGSRSTAAPT